MFAKDMIMSQFDQTKTVIKKNKTRMENKRNRFLGLAAMTLAAGLFVTACGTDDGGGETPFVEADYVGTYYGDHVISDPFLLNVITTIDSTQNGRFADTIIVTSGASTSDNIMEFESTLLNGVGIEANLGVTSGGNVTAKNFGDLVLGSTDPIVINNAQVKGSSSIRPTEVGKFTARLNLSGSLNLGGSPLALPNVSTTGDFEKR
jgi:hypothetical protein